jgi:2-dehydro-3-deoxy-D-gluconate 5-dehydrogenase
VPTDVTRYPEVEALVGRAVGELGGLDVVVNNSGIARVTPVAEMAPEEFARTIEVNLIGVFHGCRAAAAHLIGQRSGKVINLASVLGVAGLAGYSAYSASKGGVIALTKALAAEWARHGIQVNCLAPGYMNTDIPRAAMADDKTRALFLSKVPARRIGDPEETGALAVYLASSASDFMTGQTVYLDGGQTIAW